MLAISFENFPVCMPQVENLIKYASGEITCMHMIFISIRVKMDYKS